MKSTPSCLTSIGICGTDWHASRTTTAPTSCARFTIASSGLIVPKTFDWCVNATTLVPSVMTESMVDKSKRPSGVTSNQDRDAPVRAASCCQGIRFAWCSISVTTMRFFEVRAKREPGSALPIAYAIRFKDSVALFVKTISSSLAPKKLATLSRAPS